MTPLVAALEALAFQTAQPQDANSAIDDVRSTFAGPKEATSYEIALPGLDPDTYLKTKALPKLVYFLDCRGVRLPSGGGVFVSLFTSQGLFFIDAGRFAEAVGRELGLDLETLHARYGDGGTGDPKLLGP